MKNIYIVFSATPYKMGRMIRTILRNQYNHVALAFDEDLSTMYSFARFHVNVPLYGGFVEESLRRHFNAGRASRIKVCRLELGEENYAQLRAFVSTMESGADRYIYNIYSAIFTPLHVRCLIRDSYTCAEFVGDALSIAGLELPRGKFHSLTRTERILSPYVIYEGTCAEYAGVPEWGGDRFPERMGRISATAATVRAFGRLTARAVMGLFAAMMVHL